MVLLFWFLTVACSCCSYLYVGSASVFRKLLSIYVPGYSNGKSLVLRHVLVSDLPTFFFIKKLLFLLKNNNFKWYSGRKIGDAKFYIHRQHIILVYIHRTFLTAEGKQIWHKFIIILLCSIIKWPFNWQSDLIGLHASFIFSHFHLWDWPINYDGPFSAKSNYTCKV